MLLSEPQLQNIFDTRAFRTARLRQPVSIIIMIILSMFWHCYDLNLSFRIFMIQESREQFTPANLFIIIMMMMNIIIITVIIVIISIIISIILVIIIIIIVIMDNKLL